MNRTRFLVSIDGVPAAQANKFTLELGKTQGVGWWHHRPSFWIVVAPEGVLTVQKLRDMASQHVTAGAVFVCEFTEWCAFMPSTPASKKWLVDHIDAQL